MRESNDSGRLSDDGHADWNDGTVVQPSLDESIGRSDAAAQ